MQNPNDIYPVSDKPVLCSGKRGPHDLRQVGQKRMPNGRLSCRACYRLSRTETKRKAREAKPPRVASDRALRLQLAKSKRAVRQLEKSRSYAMNQIGDLNSKLTNVTSRLSHERGQVEAFERRLRARGLNPDDVGCGYR